MRQHWRNIDDVCHDHHRGTTTTAFWAGNSLRFSANEHPVKKFKKSWIERNTHVLGEKVLEQWGCDLPFLFEVLSVAKPLSIQAHPCKELAKKLHIWDPKAYKDDNHKPKMDLAITEFEALCGFANIEDLKMVLDIVLEISKLVGDEVVHKFSNLTAHNGEEEVGWGEEVEAALKQLFTQLMSASEHEVADVLTQLKSRLRKKDKESSSTKYVGIPGINSIWRALCNEPGIRVLLFGINIDIAIVFLLCLG